MERIFLAAVAVAALALPARAVADPNAEVSVRVFYEACLAHDQAKKRGILHPSSGAIAIDQGTAMLLTPVAAEIAFAWDVPALAGTAKPFTVVYYEWVGARGATYAGCYVIFRDVLIEDALLELRDKVGIHFLADETIAYIRNAQGVIKLDGVVFSIAASADLGSDQSGTLLSAVRRVD